MKNGTDGESSQKKEFAKNYPDHSIRCGTQRRDKNAEDSKQARLLRVDATRRAG